MSNLEALHDDLRFLQTNRSFLGREFLTWLWFTSETNKHRIELPNLGEFRFYVDDKLILSCASGAVRESALKGGTPAYATEAKTALLSGKLVQEAKFILQDSERQWMWSLRAEDLTVRGLRLPPSSEEHPNDNIMNRLKFTHVLFEFLDTLFKQFMAKRLSGQFNAEVDLMNEWMQNEALETRARAADDLPSEMRA